jgi:hypothetical protein
MTVLDGQRGASGTKELFPLDQQKTSPLSREGRECPAGKPAGFNVGPLGHLRRGSRATAHAGGAPPSPLRDGVAPLPVPQDRRLPRIGLKGHAMPDSLASHHHRVGMATDPRPPEADVGVCDEEAAKATGGRGTSGGLSDFHEWPQRESGREG